MEREILYFFKQLVRNFISFLQKEKDRIAVLHWFKRNYFKRIYFHPDLFFNPALSAIADGAGRGFLLGRFLPAQNVAW